MMTMMTSPFIYIIYHTFLGSRGGRHTTLCVLGLYNQVRQTEDLFTFQFVMHRHRKKIWEISSSRWWIEDGEILNPF